MGRNVTAFATPFALALAALVGCGYATRRPPPDGVAKGGASGMGGGGVSPIFGGGAGPAGGSFGTGGSVAGGSLTGGESGEGGEAERPREPCDLGSFMPEPPAVCQEWAHCERGQYVSQTPSSTRDRQCSPCPNGTFTTEPDQSVCLPWSTCPADGAEVTSGSATTDRVCSCDNGGNAVVLPSGIARCRCPFGTWGSSCSLTTLAVNARVACALRSDQRVACWRGSFFSAGERFRSITDYCGIRLDGSLDCSNFGPGAAPAGSFQSVSTSGTFACALTASGDITCWGKSDQGQLDVPPGKFISLATDGDTGHAVREDGALLSWGAPHDAATEALPPPGNYQRVVDGGNGSCAILDDGRPACWYASARSVEGASMPARVSDLAVSFDSKVCWLDAAGIPGCSGGTTLPSTPYQSISAGDQDVCGITTDGTLLCDSFQTGDLGPFVDLTANELLGVCGLTTEHRVSCPFTRQPSGDSPLILDSFLSSQSGELCGFADGRVSCSSELPQPAISVAFGYSHTCEVLVDGSLSCFGSGSAATTPPPPGKFVAVAAGFYDSCAIRDDGRALCWSSIPLAPLTPPAGQFSVVAIGYNQGRVPFADYACGIRLDGTLACWGEASDERIRPPTGRYRSLSLSAEYGCAVSFAGALECWGNLANIGPLPTGAFSRVVTERWQVCALQQSGRIACSGGDPFPVSVP